ncbi:MAG: MarR family transcriptional regulator [Proteobacteria bacterium]|nr:MarR family transcriptional regulator [Pseudomonadota bacterium]
MDLSPAAALELWRVALIESVRRDSPDLSARQMAVLLSVAGTPPPHTVRGLARTLNVSKPAITRALDRLSKLSFVRRRTDEEDRRSVLVECTEAGRGYVDSFGQLVIAAANGTRPEPQLRRASGD